MLMVLGCWSAARSSVDCRAVTRQMASFYTSRNVPFRLCSADPHLAVGIAGATREGKPGSGGFVRIGDVIAAGPAMLHGSDPAAAGEVEDDLAHIALRAGDPERLAGLSGEFAVAVADLAAGHLTLIRDHFGTLPLHYSHWGEACAFSTLVPPLLQVPWATREPDKAALAAYLCTMSAGPERTFHSSVKSVLPASRVQLSSGRPAYSRKYWRPEARRMPPAIRTAEDACEAVGAELTRAVRQRLSRFERPVFMLSGGLDSSVVTAIHCAGKPDAVDAVCSALPEGSRSKVADERRFVELLAARYPNLHVRYELAENADALEGPGQFDEWAAGPVEDPFFYMTKALFESAEARGADALVTGEGGDFCVSMRARGSALVEHLLKARPRLFARELWRVAAARGESPGAVLRSVVLPPLVPHVVRRLRERSSPPSADQHLPLSAVALKDPDTVEHLRRCGVIDFRPIRSMHDLEADLLGGLDVRGYTSFWVSAAASRSGMMPVSPLFDRPLVELIMSLPAAFKVGADQDRLLIRGAGAPFLPDVIARRPDKGSFSPDCRERWREAAGRLRERLTSAFREELFSELVDRQTVLAALDGLDGLSARAHDKSAFTSTTKSVILTYFLARFLELREWG